MGVENGENEAKEVGKGQSLVAWMPSQGTCTLPVYDGTRGNCQQRNDKIKIALEDSQPESLQIMLRLHLLIFFHSLNKYLSAYCVPDPAQKMFQAQNI